MRQIGQEDSPVPGLEDWEAGLALLRLHMLVFLLRLELAEGKVLANDVLGRVELTVVLSLLSLGQLSRVTSCWGLLTFFGFSSLSVERTGWCSVTWFWLHTADWLFWRECFSSLSWSVLFRTDLP